jgi:hypothetical protein
MRIENERRKVRGMLEREKMMSNRELLIKTYGKIKMKMKMSVSDIHQIAMQISPSHPKVTKI